MNKLVRENIKGLKPYSSARDDFQGDASNKVFMDANENPFENGVNRYPDPHQNQLKGVLSKLKGINTRNILLGNGSDEILDLVFRAFCEPKKDNIITLPPTYGMYEVLANINDITISEVFLENDFQPNVNQILKSADHNTKLLFLCSPNNPTGNSLCVDKVERLIKKFRGIVVIDEAYIDFSVQESWLKRLSEFPNLIVMQTLSKAYGMAGIRLGICYAAPEIICVLNKIKPPYNVNELTQAKARVRLKNIVAVKEEVQKIIKERDRVINDFRSIDFIQKVYPTDANFVLIKVDDANKRYHQLLKKQIVVRNRTAQALCENTLRLTVGTLNENIKLIKILKELDK